MKFKKNELKLENSLQKEWIVTNGIGGYSSSTIIGANTRRYHGLLVAALAAPAKRTLILSKLDESIILNEKKYDLYTNICKNYVSEGFQFLKSFEKEILPVFEYQIEDTKITKTICMQHRKNTVCVNYKITNGNSRAKLQLAPIFNFRDFHDLSTDHNFEISQEKKNNKIKLIIDKNISTPVYIKVSEGNYIQHFNNIFYNMFYIEEEKRGFFPEENHVVSGVFETEIKPREEKEISFICSLEDNIEELNGRDLIDEEISRINNIFNQYIEHDEKKAKGEKEKDEIKRKYLIAADNFIVYRQSFGLHTLIAGYPWFLDWGRDTLISFEGILLLSKKFDIAKEVLLTCTRDIKYGLVPNGYSEIDNSPLYNSVDSSLLLFEQVQKYLEYTEDDEFIKDSIYPKLKLIIENYSKGIDLDENNIRLEEDGLISSGTETTQNTWMDAKYANFPATPRNGKAVEINALWYNALKIMEDLSNKYEKTGKIRTRRKYAKMAEKCKESFNEKFYNKRRKCLLDVLGDNKIRPNQLFSLSLTYPVVDPTSEMAENIINTVEKKLLNNYGLKTLAKGEKNYVDTYEGDSFRRDMSYHQGITWVWLLGLYYNAIRNMQKFEKDSVKKKALRSKLENIKNNTKETFLKELSERGCIGSIAEIYDSKKPFEPKGAFAQCWSVAEVFRIILD